MEKNIFSFEGSIRGHDRAGITGRLGMAFWLYGLSGSGKSVISRLAEEKLFSMGILCYRLDGDNLRSGLNSDLGFSKKDRDENIRRAAETAKLLADAGVIVISAFITPLEKNRITAKNILGGLYNGVYIKCDIRTCIERDPKGLYKKAVSGEIEDFTGISAPFDEKSGDDLVIDTVLHNADECADILVRHILSKTALEQ
ncbi:MAG: adenylyl-sulfate kinase [Clostridia bacterium]|nr:adenylyl-sulfate kinase [Clostridia bacterium]